MRTHVGIHAQVGRRSIDALPSSDVRMAVHTALS